MPDIYDLSGHTFGELRVLGPAPDPRTDRPDRRPHWLCQCSCGVSCVKMGKYLRNGNTRSCGHVQRAYRAVGNVKHGGAVRHILTREYKAWRGMRERCSNQKKWNYKFYGARGIRVCNAWLNNYATFLRDMGPCPEGYSLDRIDTDGDYTVDNCRWASSETQHNNTRRNRSVTYKGEQMTVAGLAHRESVPYQALYSRLFKLARRMSPEDAIHSLKPPSLAP